MRLVQAETAADRLLDGCFPEQRAFIEDPSELKSALCTRRCGKTWMDAAYLLYEGMKHPRVNCLYVALSNSQAKALMLIGADPFIPKLIREYNIKAEINYSEQTVTLENGSVIWVTGTDSTPKQSQKLYGQKYKLALIDEAGSHSQDVSDLVYMKLRPAMSQGDSSGTIALTGTPENNRGFFYRVTCEDPENTNPEPGWSKHHWTFESNAAEKVALREQIADLKTKFPGIDSNPAHHMYPMFQQHYKGRWVIDRNALVYAYKPSVNLIQELPKTTDGRDYAWTTNAGLDFGFRDAFAALTVAYRDNDPTLYVTDVTKVRELSTIEVMDKVSELNIQHKWARRVGDHNPAVLKDLMTRYGVYVEPAEKQDKVAFISIMNSEWLQGRIKIVDTPNTRHLIKELEELVWDKRLLITGDKVEDAHQDNHCTDALLYVWRSLYYYLAKPLTPKETDPHVLYSQSLRKRAQRDIKERLTKQNIPFWKKR